MSAKSLEKVRADVLRVLSPLRSQYGSEMLSSAVDHMLLHDKGVGQSMIPLSGLSDDLRVCVSACSVVLQAYMNDKTGGTNRVVFVKLPT